MNEGKFKHNYSSTEREMHTNILKLVLYTWVRASWIEFNNCPTRCELFSLLHFCRQLCIFRVLTPIIRSWYNYSCTSTWWWVSTPESSRAAYRNVYTECPRRNVPDSGRVFLMLKYPDITQNTYIQSWTVTEIMAREVWNFDSCYTLTDYQLHIKTGRNMLFL